MHYLVCIYISTRQTIHISIHKYFPSNNSLLYPQTEDLLFPVWHNEQKYHLILKRKSDVINTGK